MVVDFLIALSNKLAYDLVKKGAIYLGKTAFGDAEEKALHRSFQNAFRVLLERTATGLDKEMLNHLDTLLTQFVSNDEVSNLLLGLALTGENLTMDSVDGLRNHFQTLGFDAITFPIDFDTAMKVFVEGLEAGLKKEAEKPNSPLYNKVSFEKIDSIYQTLQRITRDIDIFQILTHSPAPLSKFIRLKEFQTLVNERTRNFVGREFIFNAFDKLLQEPDFKSGYIVISGEPGIGKTALIAQLIKQKGAIHHFNIASQNIRSAQDFLGNICAQLIVRFKLGYTNLPPEATKDSGFLSQLLEEVSVIKKGQPVVVLVDALDEVENIGLPPDTNRLYMPPALPYGVFFVVTTREEYDYRLLVDRLKNIYLRDHDPHNLADVRQYIENFIQNYHAQMAQRLNQWGVGKDEFLSVLTEKSQGNFMYLVYVLDDIRDGKLTSSNVDKINNLPQGLRAYYQRHWRSMREQDIKQFEQYYEQVICILATVREPVSIGQIADWTKFKPMRIKEVIQEWHEFLNVDMGEQGEPLYRIWENRGRCQFIQLIK